MSHQNVTFPCGSGTAHGYIAKPAKSGGGPGLIIIQEWWGLTDHIKEVCDRFAEHGFTALAPDLYGGKTTHDADEAGKWMEELPEEQAVKELAGAVDFLLAHDACTSGKLGAVGFCMGGGFVVTLAGEVGDKLAAAVPFYGVQQSEPKADRIQAAVLGHYAELDLDFAPPDKALEMGKAIRDAGGEAAIHVYGGCGHAFFNPENAFGTYSETNATVAFERTLRFLNDKVV